MDLHPPAPAPVPVPARLRPRFSPRRASLAVAALAGASLVAPAFAQDARATAAQSTVSDGRPILPISSAERFASVLPDPSNPDVQSVLAGVGASQLEFFDDLERQTLVCHDDALHACLLLGAGINATSFQQRTEMAARLGWIAPSFDRPGREAATLGEVCRMLARMMGKPESITQDESLAFVSGLRVLPPEVSTSSAAGSASSGGVLPSQLKPYQGLTGSQLMTILGSVHDAIAPRESAGASALPPTSIVTTTPAATTPAQPATPSAPASPVDQVIAELTGEPVELAPSQPAEVHTQAVVIGSPSEPARSSAIVAPVRVESAAIQPPQNSPTIESPAPVEPPQAETIPAPQPAADPGSIVEPAPATDAAPAVTPSATPADPARFSQFRHGKPVKRPTKRE